MKWSLAILVAFTGLASPALASPALASPALAQDREVTLDLTPFQAAVGYAREVRPGILAGGVVGLGFPCLTWRRVSFGSRLTAGWIGESWEEGSAGTTFVVGLSPFIVRLTFR